MDKKEKEYLRNKKYTGNCENCGQDTGGFKGKDRIKHTKRPYANYKIEFCSYNCLEFFDYAIGKESELAEKDKEIEALKTDLNRNNEKRRGKRRFNAWNTDNF